MTREKLYRGLFMVILLYIKGEHREEFFIYVCLLIFRNYCILILIFYKLVDGSHFRWASSYPRARLCIFIFLFYSDFIPSSMLCLFFKLFYYFFYMVLFIIYDVSSMSLPYFIINSKITCVCPLSRYSMIISIIHKKAYSLQFHKYIFIFLHFYTCT